MSLFAPVKNLFVRRRKKACPACQGSGVCPNCTGTCEKRCSVCQGSGQPSWSDQQCDRCQGEGRVRCLCDAGRCDHCRGSGEVDG